MNYKPLITSVVMTAAMLVSPLSFSQSIEDIKKQSLQICQAQAAQMSAEQKEQVLAICNCTIENTDYEKVTEYSKEGNLAKIQEGAIKVAQDCQKKLQ